MFLGLEYIWWAIFALGLVLLTVFIWYFSRGTDWMQDEDLKHLNDNENIDPYLVDRYPFL